MACVHNVVKAIRHVHDNIDVDSQWSRAESGMRDLNTLERAQVWNVLSSSTLDIDPRHAPVVLSQYKALYKALLKMVAEPCDCLNNPKADTSNGSDYASSGGDSDDNKLTAYATLEKYDRLLRLYKGFIESLQPGVGIFPSSDISTVIHHPIDAQNTDQITNQLSALTATVGAISTRIQETLKQQESVTHDEISNQLSALRNLVDAIPTQIEVTSKQQELATHKLEQHTQIFQTLHAENKTILSKVESLEKQLSEVPALIKPAEEGYSTTNAELAAIQESIKATATKTEEWKDQTTEYYKLVEKALIGLEKQHNAAWNQLSANVKSISEHYTALQNQLDRTDQTIAGLWDALVDAPLNVPDTQVGGQTSSLAESDPNPATATTRSNKTGKAPTLSSESIETKIAEIELLKNNYNAKREAFTKIQDIPKQDKDKILAAFAQITAALDAISIKCQLAKNAIGDVERRIHAATELNDNATVTALLKDLKSTKSTYQTLIQQIEVAKSNAIRDYTRKIANLSPELRSKLQSHYEPFDDPLTSPPTWSACVSPRSESP